VRPSLDPKVSRANRDTHLLHSGVVRGIDDERVKDVHVQVELLGPIGRGRAHVLQQRGLLSARRRRIDVQGDASGELMMMMRRRRRRKRMRMMRMTTMMMTIIMIVIV
jgi:hypothetical protein